MPAGLWNPAPENIGTGWPGPPKYDAPSIGGLVGSILENRRWEQANLQNQMSGLGKAIQAQQQNQAYGEAASNAGLLPGVDTSNMSAAQISDLAQRIQQQGTEATMATYRNALAQFALGQGRQTGASAGVDFSEHAIGDTWLDPDSGIRMYQTRTGPRPFSSSLQSPDVRVQNQNQLYSEQNRLLQQKSKLDQLQQLEQAANTKALKPNVPFSRAQEYNATTQRLQEIQRQLTMPHADQTQDQTSTTQSPDIKDTDVAQAQQALQPGSSAPPPATTVPGQEPLPTNGASTQDSAARQRAIAILQQNGQPTTDANVNYVIQQLGP